MSQLTAQQWHETKPPFFWMKISDIDISKTDMCSKWLNEQITGWWHIYGSYRLGDGATYVFENKADMLTFRLWLSTNPFDGMSGEIT